MREIYTGLYVICLTLRILLIVISERLIVLEHNLFEVYECKIQCLTINLLFCLMYQNEQSVVKTSRKHQYFSEAQSERLAAKLFEKYWRLIYVYLTDFKVMMSEKCVLNVISATRSKSRSPDYFRGYLRIHLWVQWTLVLKK